MKRSNNNHEHPGRELRRLLSHIANVGITDFAALRSGPLRDKKSDAIKSIIRQGRMKGLIRAHELFDKRVYYRLTGTGCRTVGAAREFARDLGVHGRYERFALLWFCSVDGPRVRVIFNPGHDGFDVDAQRLRRVFFYLDETNGHGVLGHVMIDQGNTVPRLVAKACSRLSRYLDAGWLDQAIRDNIFEFTVLTLTQSKRDEIHAEIVPALSAHLHKTLVRILGPPPEEFPIPVYVKVVPDLHRLLPPRN